MAKDDVDPATTPNDSTGPDGSIAPPAAGKPPASASSGNWQGKRVGNFKILGFLGRGAMGRVFRAEDTRLKRHVALKVFPTQVEQGKGKVRLERFIREARSTAALDHPGIVHVYEADEFKGWYYIAMELVEGGPVGRMVEANGPFDAARACQIGAEVAEALEYAHDHGIIHRDVKPDNVLIARGGRAKLVDFGLAYRSDPSDNFHVIDEAVGTAFFIAPEICRGHGATPLSDQYSLAGTVWALLTGAPPFSGTTREELIKHQVSTPLPKLRTLRADLPEGLCRAIERGLSKKPEDRFVSCDQFAKVLRVYTIGAPASASSSGMQPIAANESATTPPPIAYAPVKPKDNRRTLLIAGGIGAVALLGIAIAILFFGVRSSSPALPALARAPVTPTIVAPTPAGPIATTPPKPAATELPPGDRFVFAGFDDNSRGTFAFAPGGSGSTFGILPTSSNNLTRDAERGMVQKLTILDDPAKQTLGDGKTDGWFVRHISGHYGHRSENTPRPTKGFVGYWLKTSAAGLRTAIAIDNTLDVTADRGVPKPVIADGQWHCYEWNLENNDDWQKWIDGDGIVNDTKDFTIDSLQFWGPNADATILIDDVSHNAGGHVAKP